MNIKLFYNLYKISFIAENKNNKIKNKKNKSTFTLYFRWNIILFI